MRTVPQLAAAFALGVTTLVVLVAPPLAPAVGDPRAANILPDRSGYLLPHITRKRNETWRWQRLMGKPRTPSSLSAARRSRSRAYRRWVFRVWRGRAARARRQAMSPPRERAWRCIQRYEARWNDPNAPYYGGLQMDLGFQRRYGAHLLRRKGTADNWTPVEQMWVAERAYRSGRGFSPWPNAARICGLI